MLYRFEIALPQSEDELLIPSHLPLERPAFSHPVMGHSVAATKMSVKSPRCIQRRYALCYVPIGFWSRLLTRLLVFIKSLLPEVQPHILR